MNKIITIGREFGSGGRELGRRLSEELGIAYYDREIIQEIAKRTALSEQYVKAVEERLPSATFPIHIGNSFYIAQNPLWEQSVAVYREQSPVSEKLADQERKQKMIEIDKSRAQYYKFFTEKKWGDKLNYDFCINTSHATIKKLIPHIVKMFEQQ